MQAELYPGEHSPTAHQACPGLSLSSGLTRGIQDAGATRKRESANDSIIDFTRPLTKLVLKKFHSGFIQSQYRYQKHCFQGHGPVHHKFQSLRYSSGGNQNLFHPFAKFFAKLQYMLGAFFPGQY